MKKYKLLKTVAAVLLAAVMIFVMASCGEAGNSTGKEDGAATGAPAKTGEPTEKPATPEATPVVTRAPTKEPSEDPTKAPESNILDPGTDFYLDFTDLGDSVFNPNADCTVEHEEEGAVFYIVAADPYATANTETGFGTAEEYRYVAIKVKASKSDLGGEYRFATTTDGRGWAMVPFEYTKPGEWEVIVLDTSQAKYMNPDTLEGEVTMVRIDPVDDGTKALSEDYCITIESIALFTTQEAAQAYKGLYVWPDEAAQAG